jgi:hypothetical protein
MEASQALAGQPVPSIEANIVRCTAPIWGHDLTGTAVNTGTGFFYSVAVGASACRVFLVTNRHVVAANHSISFQLTVAPRVDLVGDDLQPLDRSERRVSKRIRGYGGDFGFAHPDPAVDLFAIEVTDTFVAIEREGLQPRVRPVNRHFLPDVGRRKLIRDIEQVIVIGYPKGLFDEHNNLPIARMGATASHPLVRSQNRPDFMVDAAVFQGSSGSPVFIYETPMFLGDDGAYTPGTRVTLIGVLWGVVTPEERGELRPKAIPSRLDLEDHEPVMRPSMNLGVAHHADLLLAIDATYGVGL